jgi:hypothetical protein
MTRSMASRWKEQLIVCALAAAVLTAFLLHIGAVDPWLGGLAVPATMWIAWVAVDVLRAARPRKSVSKDSAART